MRGTKSLLVIGITGALVFGVAAPAMAVTVSGSITCMGTKYPQLTIDSWSAGTGTFVNQADVGQHSTFNFPGGHSAWNGPWGHVYWSANSSGFYNNGPSGWCVQG